MNLDKSIQMVHDQKSCCLENFPFLRQNRPRGTTCDCFISVMKKAIKTCDISFLALKKLYWAHISFYKSKPSFSILPKIGHKNSSNQLWAQYNFFGAKK